MISKTLRKAWQNELWSMHEVIREGSYEGCESLSVAEKAELEKAAADMRLRLCAA